MSALAKIASPRRFAGSLIVLVGVGAAISPLLAQDRTAAPDFSSNHAGWVSIGTNWIAAPDSPPPVGDHPAHPYVPNNTGQQATFRIADVDNTNLTQFAKDELAKSNDEVLRGKAMYARKSRCWHIGMSGMVADRSNCGAAIQLVPWNFPPAWFEEKSAAAVHVRQQGDPLRHDKNDQASGEPQGEAIFASADMKALLKATGLCLDPPFGTPGL